MKNKKVSVVPTIGGSNHIHSVGCSDISKSSQYSITKNYVKNIDIIESPYADYSDLEFTILSRSTKTKPNGECELEGCNGEYVEKIGENQYVINCDDADNENYYTHDENGNQIVYTLKGIKENMVFDNWENPKIFPCAKK